MLDDVMKEHRDKMQAALNDLDHAYASIRTGRASTSLVDQIQVEAYGSSMPLIQMATLSTPDARSIVIQPFDPSQINAISKALQASDLGITPNSDGRVIRLNMPQLTEERRKELGKLAHKYAEEHRVNVRQVRHHLNDAIKKAEKDGDISEDDMHRLLDEAQKMTDEYIEKIDKEMERKEEEIMEV